MAGARARGFTLIEVTVTVAILALAAAVVIPAMNNVSRAELRKATSNVAATIRANYDEAALTGDTYRMTFTFGQKAVVIKTESTSDQLNFDEKSGAFLTAAQEEEALDVIDGHPGDDKKKDSKKAGKKKDKDIDKEDDSADKGSATLGALFGISKLGARSATAGFQPKGALKLDSSIRILDVWTEGMDKATAEGEAYLYFFPTGYTQEAYIHLEDADSRVFTIKVSSLTAKTRILDGYVEAPK